MVKKKMVEVTQIPDTAKENESDIISEDRFKNEIE